jgi:hypothetical protein
MQEGVAGGQASMATDPSVLWQDFSCFSEHEALTSALEQEESALIVMLLLQELELAFMLQPPSDVVVRMTAEGASSGALVRIIAAGAGDGDGSAETIPVEDEEQELLDSAFVVEQELEEATATELLQLASLARLSTAVLTTGRA